MFYYSSAKKKTENLIGGKDLYNSKLPHPEV